MCGEKRANISIHAYLMLKLFGNLLVNHLGKGHIAWKADLELRHTPCRASGSLSLAAVKSVLKTPFQILCQMQCPCH